MHFVLFCVLDFVLVGSGFVVVCFICYLFTCECYVLICIWVVCCWFYGVRLLVCFLLLC